MRHARQELYPPTTPRGSIFGSVRERLESEKKALASGQNQTLPQTCIVLTHFCEGSKITEFPCYSTVYIFVPDNCVSVAFHFLFFLPCVFYLQSYAQDIPRKKSESILETNRNRIKFTMLRTLWGCFRFIRKPCQGPFKIVSDLP